MQTEVTVNLSKFLSDLNAIPMVMVKSIRTEIKRQLVEVQKVAMKVHRHKTRSGMMNNSIQRDVAGDGLSGQVYFETGIADYGVYVHEGHGAPYKSVTKGFPYVWQPDRSLNAALMSREPVIRADLENAINSGLAAAGLK